MSRKKQNFVEGALILTVAVGIVKAIGAVYQIAMADIIGIDGKGFYSYGYTIYNLVYSIAVSGFPVALSKVVASLSAEGRYKDVRRVKRVAALLFSAIGAVGTVGLLVYARTYADAVIKQPLAYWCIVAVAPSILFGCLMSIYRGYNQGLSNMIPTASSQVVEVIFKVASSVVLAYYVKARLMAEYRDFGTVVGSVIADEKVADITILSFAAAGAIFGVTISTAVGFIYLLIRQKARGDGITSQQLEAAQPTYADKQILKQIVAVAVPIALSAAAVNLTTVIDSVMVQDRLQHVLTTNIAAVFASHGGLMEYAGKTPDMDVTLLANFLNGAYWYAMPFFTLIPTLTGSLGMSALPHVTTAWAQRNIKGVKTHVESVLRITMLIASPAGFGLAALASPILSLIYERGGKVVPGIGIAGPMLQVLGLAAIVVAVTGPANALLQAIGRVDIPVKLMVLGGVLKVASNYILIGIPSLNIKAAPAGNCVCYLAISIISVIILCRSTGIKINLFSVFAKPLISAFACGTFALLTYNVLTMLGLSGKLSTIAGIIVAALVYVACVMILKAVTRDDVEGLPGGKKIAAFLKKMNALG